MCGPKFCSMKITQDVRDYAASLGDNERTALGLDGRHQANGAAGASEPSLFREAGMKEMSDKFNSMGQQVYVDADKMKVQHTTALDSEAAHAAKNARLVKESNKSL
jgi:phosphomethylpyrimidine synthase